MFLTSFTHSASSGGVGTDPSPINEAQVHSTGIIVDEQAKLLVLYDTCETSKFSNTVCIVR